MSESQVDILQLIKEHDWERVKEELQKQTQIRFVYVMFELTCHEGPNALEIMRLVNDMYCDAFASMDLINADNGVFNSLCMSVGEAYDVWKEFIDDLEDNGEGYAKYLNAGRQRNLHMPENTEDLSPEWMEMNPLAVQALKEWENSLM